MQDFGISHVVCSHKRHLLNHNDFLYFIFQGMSPFPFLATILIFDKRRQKKEEEEKSFNTARALSLANLAKFESCIF